MRSTVAPQALVTGASSGIGLALAQELASRGFSLLLVADEPLPTDLTFAMPERMAVQADLSTESGVRHVRAALQHFGPLDVAALNAGRGSYGRFVEIPWDDDRAVIRLNVESTVALAKLVLPGMVARRRGRVLVTSSVAATAPGPWFATYAASKAFLHSFAEAVREELRGTGVTITSLQPGPTDTGFWDRAGMREAPVTAGPMDEPDLVAREGLDAMFAGKDHVVSGSYRNAVQVAAARVLPDSVKAKLQRRQTEPADARTDRHGEPS